MEQDKQLLESERGVYKHVFVCARVCVCVYVCVPVCTCGCMHASMYLRMYRQIYVHLHVCIKYIAYAITSVYIHMDMNIYGYTCVYRYV